MKEYIFLDELSLYYCHVFSSHDAQLSICPNIFFAVCFQRLTSMPFSGGTMGMWSQLTQSSPTRAEFPLDTVWPQAH